MTSGRRAEVNKKKSEYDKAAKQYAKLQEEAVEIAKAMKPLYRRFMKLSEKARRLGMKLFEIDDGGTNRRLRRYVLDFDFYTDEFTGRFFIEDAIKLCENLANTPFDTGMERKARKERANV